MRRVFITLIDDGDHNEDFPGMNDVQTRGPAFTIYAFEITVGNALLTLDGNFSAAREKKFWEEEVSLTIGEADLTIGTDELPEHDVVLTFSINIAAQRDIGLANRKHGFIDGEIDPTKCEVDLTDDEDEITGRELKRAKRELRSTLA